MKIYTKKTREAFNLRAAEILSRFPKIPEGMKSYSHRCMSDLGIILLSIEPLEHGERTCDVCARIQNTDQFDPTKQGKPAIARYFGISLPSGKWNIVKFDTVECLDILEQQLTQVNARQPNAEEAATWELEDKTTFEKWEKLRNEWS